MSKHVEQLSPPPPRTVDELRESAGSDLFLVPSAQLFWDALITSPVTGLFEDIDWFNCYQLGVILESFNEPGRPKSAALLKEIGALMNSLGLTLAARTINEIESPMEIQIDESQQQVFAELTMIQSSGVVVNE